MTIKIDAVTYTNKWDGKSEIAMIPKRELEEMKASLWRKALRIERMKRFIVLLANDSNRGWGAYKKPPKKAPNYEFALEKIKEHDALMERVVKVVNGLEDEDV